MGVGVNLDENCIFIQFLFFWGLWFTHSKSLSQDGVRGA